MIKRKNGWWSVAIAGFAAILAACATQLTQHHPRVVKFQLRPDPLAR